MSNRKLFGKINFFDVVIICIVAVIIIAGLFIYLSSQKKVAVSGTKLNYVLEIIDAPVGLSELISIGDNISDNIKNYPIGKVTGIEKVANTKISPDLINKTMIESELPNKEKVILSVEVEVVDNGIDFISGGGYDIRVGKAVDVKGNGYAGSGFILEIKRD